MTSVHRLSFAELPNDLVAELGNAGLDPAAVYDAVVVAIEEDLPGDDVTSWATIPEDSVAWADIVARGDGVVAGLGVAELVLRYVLGPGAKVERPVADGSHVRRGDVVMSVHGPTALLLTAERTALNYACHLSGVATATGAWVRALEGTKARVRDTRKTIPHFRMLEKYAVRCGGGVNHRASLSDQALVKDNHVLACGGVVAAYRRGPRALPEGPRAGRGHHARGAAGSARDRRGQFLLDNMDTGRLAEAVRITAGRAALEASRRADGRGRPRSRRDRGRLHRCRRAHPLRARSSTLRWTCGPSTPGR